MTLDEAVQHGVMTAIQEVWGWEGGSQGGIGGYWDAPKVLPPPPPNSQPRLFIIWFAAFG